MSARHGESGFVIEPVYGHVPADLAQRLGEPGDYPYTRGVYPTMYTTKPWTMRQYAGFGTATESNARYHQLLAAGTTGLSVAFDLPTQMGFDSDSPMAHGEVGNVGVGLVRLAVEHALVRPQEIDGREDDTDGGGHRPPAAGEE